MSYNDFIKYAEEQQRFLRNSITKSLKNGTLFSINDKTFHTEMDLNEFDDDDILLRHTLLHFAFSNKKVIKIDREHLDIVHGKFVSEMRKRGIKHYYIDKLDKI